MGKRKYSDSDLNAMAKAAETKALEIYARADVETVKAGIGWYPLGHAECQIIAAEYGADVDTVAAVMAVLSPQTRWIGNVEDTWSAFAGEPFRHSLPENQAKAARLMAGESAYTVMAQDKPPSKRSNKVPNFHGNLSDPENGNFVTLDSWMARALGVSIPDLFNVYGVYGALAAGIKAAAEKLDLVPNALQAIVWLQIKLEDDRAQNGKAAASLPDPF